MLSSPRVDARDPRIAACAALLFVAICGCAPAEGRVVEGAGLRLVDANAAGLAYVDLARTLWFRALDSDAAPERVADDVDDAVMPAADAPVVVAFVGLDAVTQTAAHAVVRDANGDVRALGDDVNAAQVKASADGAHLYHEERRGTPDAGNEELFLDGVSLGIAHKEKARFTGDGVLVLGADLIVADLEDPLQTVRTYEGPDVMHEIARNGAANATAVTHDGAFVIYGANEDGAIVDLELQPIAGGAAVPLAARVADTRMRVTPDDGAVVVLDGDGGLVSVALSGAHATSTRAGDAVDIVALSADLIVTASAVDDADGTMHLEVARLPFVPASPGALGDDDSVDLGDDAVDVGVSADGSSYFFIGDAKPSPSSSAAASPKRAGTLGVFGGDGKRALAAHVRRARLVGDGLAWLDDGDRLYASAAGGDDARLVQINVDRFRAAGSKLAYSVRAETNAGIWLVDPE